jgi:hypothetical protein
MCHNCITTCTQPHLGFGHRELALGGGGGLLQVDDLLALLGQLAPVLVRLGVAVQVEFESKGLKNRVFTL